MKKLLFTLALFALPAMAQYTPPAVGAFQYSAGSWVAASTTATAGAIQFTPPAAALYCYNASTGQWVPATSACFGGSSSGTVTSFSAGTLSPLFTTSVATATTTPALTFILSNAAQNSVFAGPATGGAGAPSFQPAPTISAANMTNFPTLNQNTTGTAGGLSGSPAITVSSCTGCGGGGFPLTVVQELATSVTSNSTSCVVTFPQTTASSGNTLFIFGSVDGSSTITTPTGWTQDLNEPATTYARFVMYHKASASDTAATITSASASSCAVYFMEVSGSHALDVSSVGAVGNENTVVLPSITPTAGAVVFGFAAIVLNSITNSGPYQFARETISSNWKTLNVTAFLQANGARALAGHVSTVAATHVATIPPALSMPEVSLFSSGGIAYASFSIL